MPPIRRYNKESSPYRTAIRRNTGGCLAVVLVLTGFAFASQADPRIELKPGDLGNDSEFLIAFLENKIERGGESFEKTFSMFAPPFNRIRLEYSRHAYHDLNGDGKNELIFQFEHPYTCGSAGCWTFIFRNRRDNWVEIGESTAGKFIEIGSPMINGWPRLFSHEVCMVWNGKKYISYSNDKYESGIDSNCIR